MQKAALILAAGLGRKNKALHSERGVKYLTRGNQGLFVKFERAQYREASGGKQKPSFTCQPPAPTAPVLQSGAATVPGPCPDQSLRSGMPCSADAQQCVHSVRPLKSPARPESLPARLQYLPVTARAPVAPLRVTLQAAPLPAASS